MTKEERAEKWFRGIQDSELISIEEKMYICDKGCKEDDAYIFWTVSTSLYFAVYDKWR